MAGELEFLRTAIMIFLSIFVPGFPLALALLKKTKMSLAEIAAFGFIFGLIFPPITLWLLSFFGILYSPALVIINIVVVTVIGFLLCINEGALNFKLSFNYKRDAAFGILLLIMLFAFWVRIQSLTPIFYEFDPYYYDQIAQFVLTQGQVPLHDSLAWYHPDFTNPLYPNFDSHRTAPIVTYLKVQWYAIHGYVTGNQAFDNYLLSTVGGSYPPVVAAMLCFLIFVLISEGYGRKYGLIGAALFAILPMPIEKFAAGESEVQPWGIFAAFFFYAALALAVSRKDRRFAILAGIAVLSATLGSNADVLAYLVFAGYIGLQSMINYLRNKSNRELIEMSLIVLCFAILAYILYSIYVEWSMPSDIMSFSIAILFAIGLELISQRVKNPDDRINYLFGYLIVGGLLVLATFIPGVPLAIGPRVWNYINNAASVARPSSPLMMTVAEESPTNAQFAGALGLLGSTSGLVYAILFLSLIAIVYSIYRGSEIGLMFGMMIFPISYVGMSKSKYMLHVAFMIAVAVTMFFGELDKLMHGFLKKSFGENTARWTVFGVALLMLSAESLLYSNGTPGPLIDVVGGTLDSKYALQTPELAVDWGRNCNLLVQDQKEIASYLFCSRIPQYWRDSMDWIKANVGDEDRVMSWWDYGHWINYWGQKKCLTRNDHLYQSMDLEVADKFVSNTPEAMRQYMIDHKAKYVLFDQDLIGKWGALNFLSCVYNNQTNMTFAFQEGQKYNTMYALTTSQCEREHSFESIAIPVQPTISDFCQSPDPSVPLLRAYSTMNKTPDSYWTYCIAYQTQGNQTKITAMLYEDNLSKPNKATLAPSGIQSMNGRDYYTYTLLYTKDVYPDGTTGWGDRKGKMYDSNFYQGFFLGNLTGFDLVYDQPGYIRIYKIKE